jgi:hypothetical protein
MYRKGDRPAELTDIYFALEKLDAHLPARGQPGHATARAALEIAFFRLDELGRRINAAAARRAA